MASLKKAAQCIGITGAFSVVHDFFGFFAGTPTGTTVSVFRQIELLGGRHFHVNLIRTAFFDDTLRAKVDGGLQRARDIFAVAGIGIGRVEHHNVPQGGYEILMDADVAFDLWDSWSTPNDGIDAFLPYALNGPASGRAPDGEGSCDKDDKDSGIAVGVVDNLTAQTFGEALAHELGHFMGLDHKDDEADNLMFPEGVPTTARLDAEQIETMKEHCAMRAACSL